MSESEQEPECYCEAMNLVHVENTQDGELVRCEKCGREYYSTSDDLVLVDPPRKRENLNPRPEDVHAMLPPQED